MVSVSFGGETDRTVPIHPNDSLKVVRFTPQIPTSVDYSGDQSQSLESGFSLGGSTLSIRRAGSQISTCQLVPGEVRGDVECSEVTG